MTQGFTLIELLVVVLIIGILSAVALPQYTTAVERSRATEGLTQMAAVAEAAERYHAQHDEWPSTFTQLDVDIPPKASCTSFTPEGYGGKHFCLYFSDPNNKFKIRAARTRGSHAYYMFTTITAQDNGTYTAVRSCEEMQDDDQEAIDYCNAISGGNPDNF